MTKVLCYNFDRKSLVKLNVLAMRCGGSICAVSPQDYGKTLEALLTGSESENAAAENFEGRMLVMCGLKAGMADRFLDGLRAAKLSKGVLKAVLTETNKSWSSVRLYQELCAERDAIAQGRPAHEQA